MKTRSLFLQVLLLLSAGLLLSASAQQQPMFEQPILISSAGQSADVTLAGMLCKKINITPRMVNMATAADLAGIKTLFIVAGFSSKGLGAAGISREKEMARVVELLAAAKEKKIPVALLHIGGKARRGSQSDDFNAVAAEASSYMLVVKQGDEDGFFSQLAAKRKIPIVLVNKIAEAAAPLASVVKQ